jgi:uncharacterized membrane protein
MGIENLICVRGNHEDYLKKIGSGESLVTEMHENEALYHMWEFERLSDESRRFLDLLPVSRFETINEVKIYVIHYPMDGNNYMSAIRDLTLQMCEQMFSDINADIILLALNTVISALILYIVFYIVRLSDFTGLLAIIFAIVYLVLGRFVEKFMTKEQKARALFYITGLTFVVLIIPFQFGKVWLSLGWLVEGIALLSYGIYKEIKDFKRAGIVISMLCLGSFILFDLTDMDKFFIYKYLAITAGSIIVLGSLIYKKTLADPPTQLFKYAAVINMWIFSLYIIASEFNDYLSYVLSESRFHSDYLVVAAMILVSYAAAYVIPRIRILCDNIMKGISVTIYALALLALFFLNLFPPVRGYLTDVPLAISAVGTMELIVVTVLSILAMRDLILCLVMERKLGIEWYPLVLSSYFVLILTQNLITQFNLGFNNALISIIYIITALAWITLGFIKRYVFIRRFGLGLSILSVAKLFLIDLSFLSQGYRVISYFVFGVTLIAISFVYQHFNKRIDTICEVMPNDKKTIS